MKMIVQIRDDDSVRIVIFGAEPTQARWVCNLGGIGRRVASSGDIAVALLDEPKKPALTIRPRAGGMDVPDTEQNRATSGDNCGFNGSVVWNYARAEPAPE